MPSGTCLGIVVSVEFDGDISFITQVHAESNVQIYKYMYHDWEAVAIKDQDFAHNFGKYKKNQTIEDRHFFCQGMCSVMALTVCLYIKHVILHAFLNMCHFWSKLRKRDVI